MTEPAALPPHAYVPGQTERHPEGAFDDLRVTVHAGMTEVEIQGTPAFQVGLTYLETGYFWEAHEVLEPVWMACAPNSVARSVTQGLIQLANARLKIKMNRPRAALRLLDIAKGHLQTGAGRVVLGVDCDGLLADIESEIRDL